MPLFCNSRRLYKNSSIVHDLFSLHVDLNAKMLTGFIAGFTNFSTHASILNVCPKSSGPSTEPCGAPSVTDTQKSTISASRVCFVDWTCPCSYSTNKAEMLVELSVHSVCRKKEKQDNSLYIFACGHEVWSHVVRD